MLKKTASLIGATVVATGLVTVGATTAAHAKPDGCYVASVTERTLKIRCSSGYGYFQMQGSCMTTSSAGYEVYGNIAHRTPTTLNAASGITCPAGTKVNQSYYYNQRWD